MEHKDNKPKNNWLSKIKSSLDKRKNIFLGLSILVVGIALGVGGTIVSPYVMNSVRVKSQPETTNVLDEAEIKKQSLAEFYNEIVMAEDAQGWPSLYKLVRQSVRDNVTESQFSAYYSKRTEESKVISKETVVNNIEINGDSGIVDRTFITCLSEDCTGENRIESNAQKTYEFINGKWQIPDPEPSERALKAANYGYQNSSQSDQKDIVSNWAYGSDSPTYAVRNWAVYLDENLEELIRVETIIEQDKLDKSRPIYNQQPAQIIQQPAPVINQPAPVIQQNTYPKHCTSNTIGDYTYTNCY